MHQTEARELVPCGACGAEITPGFDRTYAVSDDVEICYACAVERHGVYDEAHDRWTEPPDVGDLAPLLREAEP